MAQATDNLDMSENMWMSSDSHVGEVNRNVLCQT